MADPATTVAVSGFAAGAALAGIANQLGIPVPTLVVAVIGATVAVSVSDRIKWSAAGVWAGLSSFVLALAIGITGGQFASSLLVQALAFIHIVVPADACISLCTLILSVLGQSVVLPAIAKRFGAEIEKRGAPQ